MRSNFTPILGLLGINVTDGVYNGDLLINDYIRIFTHTESSTGKRIEIFDPNRTTVTQLNTWIGSGP